MGQDISVFIKIADLRPSLDVKEDFVTNTIFYEHMKVTYERCLRLVTLTSG